MIDNDLINAFLKAQVAEQRAKAKRRKLCEQIADALGRPDEGSKTHTCGDYKVTVKQPVNRKVDWSAFLEIAKDLEHAPYENKPQLDLTGLRWIEQHDSDAFLKLAKTITATPGQVSVEIKEPIK